MVKDEERPIFIKSLGPCSICTLNIFDYSFRRTKKIDNNINKSYLIKATRFRHAFENHQTIPAKEAIRENSICPIKVLIAFV